MGTNLFFFKLNSRFVNEIHFNEVISVRTYDEDSHDDVIKWKHFPRYWAFVRGIHRSPMNSPHKGQWRRDLVISLICPWINGYENKREAGDLRRHRGHYDVRVLQSAYTRGTKTLYVLIEHLYIYNICCDKVNKDGHKGGWLGVLADDFTNQIYAPNNTVHSQLRTYKNTDIWQHIHSSGQL